MSLNNMVEGYVFALLIFQIKKWKHQIVLKKVEELIDESSVNIPDSTTDRAHRTGKKKGKRQAVIARFTTHRHRTLFYKARKKIKRGPEIYTDLTRKRFNLLEEAQYFVPDQEDDVFV